jgi:hypothetical protein
MPQTRPPASPKASTVRPTRPTLGGFSFRNFIGYLSLGVQSPAPATACIEGGFGWDPQFPVRACYEVIITRVPSGIWESSVRAVGGTRTQPLLTASPNTDGSGQP